MWNGRNLTLAIWSTLKKPSIPFSWNNITQRADECQTNEMEMKRAFYHQAAVISPPASLFEVWHDQRPHTHNIGNNQNEDGDVNSPELMARSTSSSCSVLLLQADDYKLSHGERVQATQRTTPSRVTISISTGANRRLRNRWMFICTHGAKTPEKSQQGGDNLQKWQLLKQSYQRQPPLFQPQTDHEWHHFKNGPRQTCNWTNLVSAQVRINTQRARPRSSISILSNQWASFHPITCDKIRGSIPFTKRLKTRQQLKHEIHTEYFRKLDRIQQDFIRSRQPKRQHFQLSEEIAARDFPPGHRYPYLKHLHWRSDFCEEAGWDPRL